MAAAVKSETVTSSAAAATSLRRSRAYDEGYDDDLLQPDSKRGAFHHHHDLDLLGFLEEWAQSDAEETVEEDKLNCLIKSLEFEICHEQEELCHQSQCSSSSSSSVTRSCSGESTTSGVVESMLDEDDATRISASEWLQYEGLFMGCDEQFLQHSHVEDFSHEIAANNNNNREMFLASSPIWAEDHVWVVRDK